MEANATAAPPLAPVALDGLVTNRIDKSELAIAEPKRRRDKAHLKFVASQPCLVCGRQPSDPHHLRFAQPRAIGLKVSDEFTVPLCRGHHRQLHQAGNEEALVGRAQHWCAGDRQGSMGANATNHLATNKLPAFGQWSRGSFARAVCPDCTAAPVFRA